MSGSGADGGAGGGAASGLVLLAGRPGGTTHREVELLDSLPAELRLIGGLAVMCRVGSPHRTTVDIDAVTRGLGSLHASLSHMALTASGGGQYGFDGSMELDVIEVAPLRAAKLVAELSAAGPLADLELNVVAHTWAHDTATPMHIVAVDEVSGAHLAEARDRLVASTAGLVAMKATTVALRASSRPEKRASDLYDLGRLLVRLADSDADRTGMVSMPPLLLDAVGDRVRGWFVDPSGRDRTYREVRRFDDPRLELDEVADAAEDVFGAGDGAD